MILSLFLLVRSCLLITSSKQKPGKMKEFWKKSYFFCNFTKCFLTCQIHFEVLREGFTKKSRKKSGVLPNLPRKNPTFPQKRLFDSSKLLVQPSTHTHLNASLISIFVTIHDLWMWAFFYQMSFSGLARNYCSSLRHFPMQARPTTILSLALQYL